MKKIYLVIQLFTLLFITSCKQEMPSIADEVEIALKQDGISNAIEVYKKLKLQKPAEYIFDYSELYNLGIKLITSGNSEDGIKILELNAEQFPDSVNIYSAISRAYFSLNDRENSIKYFNKFKSFGFPSKLDDIIFMKKLFFVPEGFKVPQRIENDEFVLRQLKASDVDLDFAAVMSSKLHIKSIMRQYPPEELTKEDDLKSLQYHERQFKTRTGFVYTVMKPDETECYGCVYITPSRLDDFNAEIVMWTTKSQFDLGLDAKLLETVENWMKVDWPFEKVVYPGRSLDWKDFYTKLDEQDKKYNY